ncbi:MAG: beta-N-acetylhexosaminidase, partial [Adhaeribacter sp.]
CKSVLFALAAFFLLNAGLQAQERYAIIPKPVKLVPRKGTFSLNEKTRIVVEASDPQLKTATDFLVGLVSHSAGYQLGYGTKAGKNTISFVLDKSIANEEGYQLVVSPKAVRVKAKSPKGAFLAIQTLRQLMPADIEAQGSGLKKFGIPAVEIEDAPRFAYRGMMFDVGRYFFPISFLRQYIDLLVLYKINTFHLHLTDDQGWRMEIKKYPRLQEVAAWRKETLVGHYFDKPKKYDGKRHGGFYTQAELKDLVKYAQDRFITIIPEIEMPGHSTAALAAYPELGCREGATYEVSTTWWLHRDVYCPNEFTFTFLQDVLTEVMEVFPSRFIHIGGDEAPKDRWKESAFAQELIKKENLKDEHELQSYFIQSMEKFLNSRGRSIIGWDEILEGGLAPNATVMSWRGEKGGIAAAKQKHQVIMSPNIYMYLNYYQTKEGRKKEPIANGGFLPLEKVYSYNPVPASLTAEEARYILGVQANVWTEYISTPEHAFHMTFPRACAMAEVAWTPLEQKDYQEFLGRLKENLKHLEKQNVKYSRYFLEEEAPSAQGARP